MSDLPGDPSSAAVAIRLFREYAVHTFFTVGIYLLLVAATWLLHYTSHLALGSQLHQWVLVGLEGVMFVIGTVLLLLVNVYLTAVFLRDLTHNFRNTFRR